MPKEFSRARRVEEQIKRELSAMIREELNNTEIGMVTFTAVQVSSDMSLAKVYFTLLGASVNEKQGENILNEASPHLRHCLSKIMTMRTVPRLNFSYDISIERANQMEALLDQVAKETKKLQD